MSARAGLLGLMLASACAACVGIPFESSPGPHAGEGTVLIEPDRVEASAEVRLRLSYQPGPAGLAQDGGFRVELAVDPTHPHLGFTPPSVGDSTEPGAVSCYTTRGAASSRDEAIAQVGGPGEVRCLLAGGYLGPSDALVMEYQGLAPRVSGPRALHVESRFSGGAGGRPLERPPVLDVSPRAAAVLHVVTPSEARAGAPMTLAIAALDLFGNRARDYQGTVAIEMGGVRLEHRFTAEEKGVTNLTVVGPVGSGFQRAVVTELSREAHGAGRRPLSGSSNPTLVLEGEPRRILWGDPHFHTGDGDSGRAFVSPGECAGDHRGNYTTQEEAWAYARDVMSLDFAACTEHTTATLDERRFSLQQLAASRATDPGRFTALAGLQWRDLLLLPAGPMAWLPDAENRLTDTVAELASALDGSGTVVVATSRAARGEWGALRPQAVEVYSWLNRGDEYEDRPALLEPGPSWRLALRPPDGWAGGEARPPALVGASANHWSHPGADDLTGLEPGHGGLTAVLAQENTRQAILEAIESGRVWATTGARIYLSARSRAGRLEVAAAGTAPLARVDLVVVTGSTRIETPLLEAQAEEISVAIDEPTGGSGGGFYFVRVVQTDGEMAWSSPRWLGGRVAARGEADD